MTREGLTLETSAFNFSPVATLYLVNSVDRFKFLWGEGGGGYFPIDVAPQFFWKLTPF